MNYKILTLLTFLTLTITAQAEKLAGQASVKGGFCAIDKTPEASVFYCMDVDGNNLHTESVEVIEEHRIQSALEERGVSIISINEYAIKAAPEQLQAMIEGPNEAWQCLENVYYRVDEFNRLSSSHSTISQLKKLAKAMQAAGVCDVPVKKQNFKSIGINIQSSQDVLHHFLCISNSESVFGTRNIGMGGRGPWGIHPAHNQKKGTRAFIDGKTRTLPRNGLCYPGNAIVRNQAGQEIKQSRLYLADDVILANAQCAIKLYKQKGFTDWGTTKKWGSNRHCTSSTRDRLQFFKHIGALGCCTQACKDKFKKGTDL